MSDSQLAFTSRPASRQSARLLIGFFGESGSGKTKSALLLARGIAGPSGRITMIDTESGRGEFFADEIPGGYDVIPMDAPFSPARAIGAIEHAERIATDVLIYDSASHSWEGLGGVLDMASDNEQAGKKGLSVWKGPKMEHAKFVLKLMQSKMTVIVCLRAKYKNRQVKNGGRTEIVRDDFLTPIQSEDFLFELTLHMQVNPDHSVIVTKKGRADLRQCLPADNSGPITIQHGAAIAAWAQGGAVKPAASANTAGLKKRLFALTKDAHGGDQEKFWSLLRANSFIEVEEFESRHLTDERLAEVIERVEAA